MAPLTEAEIFDCLTHNLGEAAAFCDQLTHAIARGPLYEKLRDRLQLVEGCCRMMGLYRSDMRYQVLGMGVAQCHKRAGNWLRIHAAPRLFAKLAETLRKVASDIERLRHSRTGRRGPILVPTQPGLHRDTRPVYVRGGNFSSPSPA